MPPPDDAPPAERRAERLEPTTVGTGRVLITVAALFALLGGALAGLLLLYGYQAGRSQVVADTRFPAPRLETSIDPRATADSGHGPRPYLRPPPDARAQELAPAPPPLKAAMAAVAARGADGYGPPAGATR